MHHLILSREYPPTPYPQGGIGTYVANIARLLAEAGERVTVIGQQWSKALEAREEFCDGRLVIRRVPCHSPVSFVASRGSRRTSDDEIEHLRSSTFPMQAFSWNAAVLAEHLIETDGIDTIEAQEWEAPMYYFLQRRVLGLGPARKPACFVHLHSPTEMIFQHNEWSISRDDYLPMARYEEYCIRAADALMCPSNYLARQVVEKYRIPSGSIRVLPLPTGDFPVLHRNAEVWNARTFVYVGRLEPRKGLIEWIDAAVDVAQRNENVRFELVGADLPYRSGWSVGEYLKGRIPESLRPRFIFQGVKFRSQLGLILESARAAVVPSRWENFPNTCMEAMCSGLPVVVSPNGGMMEMVEDGVTGWIAKSQTSADLAEAMQRAVDTDGPTCAEMGRSSAVSIRKLCDNEKIVACHIEFRAEIADAGAKRSNAFVATHATSEPMAEAPTASGRGGILVVIDAVDQPEMIETAIAAVAAQKSNAAGHVLVVQAERVEKTTLNNARACGWRIVQTSLTNRFRLLREVIEEQITSANAAGVVILPPFVVPNPPFLGEAEKVLNDHPAVGIVSYWISGLPSTARPAPGFPFSWILCEGSPAPVIRSEAFLKARWMGEESRAGLLGWATTISVMAEGWMTVTLPMILASIHENQGRGGAIEPREVEVRRRIRACFPDVFARYAGEVVLLLEDGVGRPLEKEAPPRMTVARGPRLGIRDIRRMPLKQKLLYFGIALKNPRRAGAWLKNQIQRLRGRFQSRK